MAQLRLNANGIEAIEALFAQLRGFVSHFRARDAADSTNGVNSVTTRPDARVCAALCSWCCGDFPHAVSREAQI